MKKALVMLLVVALLAGVFGLPPVRAAEGVTIQMTIGSTKAYVNSKEVILDQPPIIENGRTLAPVRFINEAIGAKVDWNSNTKMVTITVSATVFGDMNIVLTIGSTTAIVNGIATILDVAPKILPSGRTVVPVRFISETIGAKVDWYSNIKMVTITVSATPKAIRENMVVINGMPVIQPDPALSMDWYDMQVIYNLYSPLVYPTPKGTIRPHLAQDWKAVDGKLDHWRFTLRQGVKFHDGSELTSEDIVFSMDRFITMGQGFSGVLSKVKAIAVDKYVVDFILEKPNGVFPETLTLFFSLNKRLVLEHIQAGKYGEFGDYGEKWLMTHDAGSGPYVMASHKTGESMEATRFKEYFLGWENWGPNEVPIERLKFIMESSSSTLILLLKKGQLQLEANGAFSRQTFKEIVNTEGLHLNQVWPQVWTVWMNTKVPPTDDVHFRNAILYAYDYEAILGEYAPFGAREAGIYPSTLPGYIAIPPQPRKQNLEKAKEELALSKYKPGDVKVVFHYCGGLEAEEEIGLQLQADLSKLGIKVEIVGPNWPQYEAECATPETTPNLTIFMFPLNYVSADSFLYYMYHPSNVGGIYAAHWYKDEELGRLIDQSRGILDSEKRLEIYRQIQEKIASQVLAFYPYEIPALFTSQDYLIGPKETFPVVGPTINMHNWRINLTKK